MTRSELTFGPFVVSLICLAFSTVAQAGGSSAPQLQPFTPQEQLRWQSWQANSDLEKASTLNLQSTNGVSPLQNWLENLELRSDLTSQSDQRRETLCRRQQRARSGSKKAGREHVSASEALRSLSPYCQFLLRRSDRKQYFSWDAQIMSLYKVHARNGHEEEAFFYENESWRQRFYQDVRDWIVDESFTCRHPFKAKVFSKKFQMASNAWNCTEARASFQLSKSLQYIEIDPKRVFRIDYLLIERGNEMVTSFGHSLYRIVVCAPDREVVNEDCLQDISNHIVVSFRARHGLEPVDKWKGLSGKYPALMVVAPFLETWREYRYAEKRAIETYPLNYSREQIEDFTLWSSETFWDFNGRYKFIDNNCATEALELAQAPSNRYSLYFKSPITPYGVLDELREAKVARSGTALDVESFDSEVNSQLRALKNIGDNLEGYIGTSFEDYYAYYPQEITPWIESLAHFEDHVLARSLAASLFLLEKARLRKLNGYVNSLIAAQLNLDENAREYFAIEERWQNLEWRFKERKTQSGILVMNEEMQKAHLDQLQSIQEEISAYYEEKSKTLLEKDIELGEELEQTRNNISKALRAMRPQRRDGE